MRISVAPGVDAISQSEVSEDGDGGLGVGGLAVGGGFARDSGVGGVGGGPPPPHRSQALPSSEGMVYSQTRVD